MIKKCKIEQILKHPGIFLAGLTVFFFLFSLLQVFFFTPVLSRDGIKYLTLAQRWLETGNFQTVVEILHPGMVSRSLIPPFLLFWIKTLTTWGIPPEIAGRGLNIICGCMLPIITYLIAEEIQKDRRVSLAAALLIALNPSLHEITIEVLRDMVYICFCGWCILFALRGLLRKSAAAWCGCSIFLAAAVLTRYETLEMFPLIFMGLLAGIFYKHYTWKTAILHGGLFFICFCAVLTGMICIMDVQDHIFGCYLKFLEGKLDMLHLLYLMEGQGG